MISETIKTTTKRLIIHEAESTHKYYHKYPLEIHSTRKKLKQTTYKTLGKLEENPRETSGYFTVAWCPLIPSPRAHATNKQGGKPAGQDTSSYIKQGEVKKLIFENDAFRNRVSTGAIP